MDVRSCIPYPRSTHPLTNPHPQQSSQSQSGFQSRRSYPALHHVSLSPLNPRFPIDDDTDARDYFSPRHETPGSPGATRTSYLSSFSVPGTPGVLSHSHSRSGSRVRLNSRSKSSTRIHSSDTNLQSQGVASPLHHHNEPQRSRTPRHHPTDSTNHRHHPDTEWMLRAGIALASSTREEKGQSWLVKRQSSTSLVSDGHQLDLDSQQQHWSSRSTRHPRSGLSTPAAYSRRASRSRPTSRRSSRPDLAMTSLDITRATTRRDVPTTTTSGIHTPLEIDYARHLLPDFVDERIRAEMANIQHDEDEDTFSNSSSTDSMLASEDEIDEQELQRLTREQGFGLGSWIDRMVEWTLFGVDDWPLSAPPPQPLLEHHDHIQILTDEQDHEHEHPTEEADTISIPDSDIASIHEKPGERGGWEDAGWLFRIVRRALS
ncbi:hypothetical protein BO94DRAFT_511514 [Aspergillus sclerotioniger CBS 115572]|uniref:Uncharacterized protein n=1 Tax=Aspergillus sclerotioniger CBS 115572 TaxID=1450535 RepID=A0A317X532_9EURO|nr:hypothetical protein BO94DRAFT_511514 [Aspergillus sclerotioniger CBS 115572]PWY93696.1 hypothetical protein BO94DRAFT_511514 [Aspergillus sclerotioniger CBS 115572]